MPYPLNVLLPVDAKYFGFVENKIPFRSEWDLTWSFTYALTANPGDQYGFCTFLTTDSTKISGYGGQYLGYLSDDNIVNYLTTESSIILTTEDEIPLITSLNSNILAIAFDTTGYFALSSDYYFGTGISNIKRNSLIIRNSDSVLYNIPLSSLTDEWTISSITTDFKTLRFRLANGGTKLSIDYSLSGSEYKTLTSLPINLNFDNGAIFYPAFSFCTPLSSNTSSTAKMFLQNFHVQGNSQPPTFE